MKRRRVTCFKTRYDLERPTVAVFYQRCFGQDLPEAATRVKVA